ncbi:MAG: methionine biosynthesis protein MetW [Caulobacteraceae bacterium]
MSGAREDFEAIAALVRPRSRVLDVGCGEGTLLDLLTREKQVDGRGIEISPEGVSACLARGLAVVQGDADRDLDDFLAGAFDYVILSQTLQAVLKPRHVLGELLRIGERAIVSLPNFGHWRVRLDLLIHGRMPVTDALPEPWWATPNIHLCTVRDFTRLCGELDLNIDACAALADGKPARPANPHGHVETWRAEAALFVLSRRSASAGRPAGPGRGRAGPGGGPRRSA